MTIKALIFFLDENDRNQAGDSFKPVGWLVRAGNGYPLAMVLVGKHALQE